MDTTGNEAKDTHVKKFDHDKKMKVSKPKSKSWEKENSSKASDNSSAKKSSKNNKSSVVEEPTKVVVRRLPSSMKEADFLKQVSPLPEYDYFYFVEADKSLEPHAFSRAYLNFVNTEDIYIFQEKFDGYVFVDNTGNEYPAVVEFAPYQKVPKPRPNKRKDNRMATIDTDPEYLKFLEAYEKGDEVPHRTVEQHLEDMEAKERERAATEHQSTPLLEFIKEKKAERARLMEEKREAKKREDAKKRARNDERKKKGKDKEPSEKADDGGGGGGGGGRAPQKHHAKQSKEQDEQQAAKGGGYSRVFYANREGKGKAYSTTKRDARAEEKPQKEERDKTEMDAERLERQKKRDEEFKQRKEKQKQKAKEKRERAKEGESKEAGERPAPDAKEEGGRDAAADATGGGGGKPKRYSDRRKEDHLKREMAKTKESDPDQSGHVAVKPGTAEKAAERQSSAKHDNAQSASERAERKDKLKNKERPERQIYRPGMGKFSSQTIKREDGAGEADEDQGGGGGHGEGRGRGGGRRGGSRTFFKSAGGGT